MFNRLFHRRVAEKHCHDPACNLFNYLQEFKYETDTWAAPGEWIEEPYCRACGTDIGDDAHDYELDSEVFELEAVA